MRTSIAEHWPKSPIEEKREENEKVAHIGLGGLGVQLEKPRRRALQKGVSGAPVFSMTGNLIGIHHESGESGSFDIFGNTAPTQNLPEVFPSEKWWGQNLVYYCGHGIIQSPSDSSFEQFCLRTCKGPKIPSKFRNIKMLQALWITGKSAEEITVEQFINKIWQGETLAVLEDSCDSEWPRPCENTFEEMAKESPLRLIEWISCDEIRPPFLTYALEILGKTEDDSSLVSPVLLSMTYHQSPLVREGAVYGLENHIGFRGVRERLFYMSSYDPIPGVTQACLEVLGE